MFQGYRCKSGIVIFAWIVHLKLHLQITIPLSQIFKRSIKGAEYLLKTVFPFSFRTLDSPPPPPWNPPPAVFIIFSDGWISRGRGGGSGGGEGGEGDGWNELILII